MRDCKLLGDALDATVMMHPCPHSLAYLEGARLPLSRASLERAPKRNTCVISSIIISSVPAIHFLAKAPYWFNAIGLIYNRSQSNSSNAAQKESARRRRHTHSSNTHTISRIVHDWRRRSSHILSSQETTREGGTRRTSLRSSKRPLDR